MIAYRPHHSIYLFIYINYITCNIYVKATKGINLLPQYLLYINISIVYLLLYYT